jgi:hypothetical protein
VKIFYFRRDDRSSALAASNRRLIPANDREDERRGTVVRRADDFLARVFMGKLLR